jgi:hypothetical protein
MYKMKQHEKMQCQLNYDHNRNVDVLVIIPNKLRKELLINLYNKKEKN